jgi:hypothetical protein
MYIRSSAHTGRNFTWHHLNFLLVLVIALVAAPSFGQGADLSVSPTDLNFFNVPINTGVSQTVTVTNTGPTDGNLDVSLDSGGGCDPFSLPGLSGPVTVPAYGSVDIQVSFVSAVDQDYACHLNLGGGLTDVPLAASIWTPTLGWFISDENLDFGLMPLTVWSSLEVTVTNSGGLPFTVTPSIDADCTDFEITGGGNPEELGFGDRKTIEVTFTPSAVGSRFCQLDLGTIVTPVGLEGFGVTPVMTWIIQPDTLDFGKVAAGGTRNNYLTIENTGNQPIPVSPSVDAGCLVFTPLYGDQVVQPGEIKAVHVEFQPFVATTYRCDLSLGTILPDVPMVGIGLPEGTQWDVPDLIDFGTRSVGNLSRKYFAVRNTGTLDIQLNSSIPDTCQSFQLLSGGGLWTIPPGGQRNFTVDFLPVVPGSHQTFLNFGATVPPIPLVGEALPLPFHVAIDPNPLSFGWRFLGNNGIETVTLTNSGGEFADLTIALADTGQSFRITRGAGSLTLPPGQGHEVDIEFDPAQEGTFQTSLNLGAQVGPVAVSGSAETMDNVCTVSADTLVFGPLEPGQFEILDVTITNNSHQTQHIFPYTWDTGFKSLQQGMDIPGGGTVTVNVRFIPADLGTYSGTLNLNNEFCQDVALIGLTTLQTIPGQNQVGIYFDTEYRTNQTHTFQLSEVVQGYLVMNDPSETSGVSAWELRTNLIGEATWLGWQLEGQAINFGSYEEFIVGIGGPPLPYGPQVLLATFTMLVNYPYPEPVQIELHPIRQPSLPDAMVWAPASDPGMLMALVTSTGMPLVAGINVSDPSDVGGADVRLVTRLLPNVPNPFNPQTEIRFELSGAQQARVVIYDIKGRLVKILADANLPAGPHARVWQGRDSGGRQVPSGLYYVRMETGNRTDQQKIMLLK